MISRRDEAVELKKTGLNYAEIGRRLGISRERVRQIATDKPTPQKPAKVMLTVGDVAQFLGVHPNTVRHWSESGILKSYRIGPRSDRRFRREEMDDFLNGGENSHRLRQQLGSQRATSLSHSLASGEVRQG